MNALDVAAAALLTGAVCYPLARTVAYVLLLAAAYAGVMLREAWDAWRGNRL